MTVIIEIKKESLVLKTREFDRYRYCRSGYPELDELSALCAYNYGVEDCIITPSGMNAISTLTQAIIQFHQAKNNPQNVNIIHGNELYCETSRTLHYNRELYKNVSLWEVDVTNSDSIIEIFQTNYHNGINILFIESCTNPNGYIFDYSIITTLRKLSEKLYVVVDNTWLTEVIFNPFNHGANYVVTSLTKYPSGGNCICGAIVSNSHNNKKIMNRVSRINTLTGIHISPVNCMIVLKYIKNMRDRIIKSSNLTLRVLQYLQSNPKIHNLMHPSQQSHKSHEYAKKYFTKDLYPSVTFNPSVELYPSVMTFLIKYPKNKVMDSMQTLKEIEFKTSFGGSSSRFDTFLYMVGEYTFCRLAIGYDDTYENVISGINNLLFSLESNSN